MSTRRATHAGSWYTSDPGSLGRELDDWLHRAANQDGDGDHARAIIGPHAGYRYCGACAAYAYRQIDPSRVRRVFVLGPSHHYRSDHLRSLIPLLLALCYLYLCFDIFHFNSLGGCAVSSVSRYETPLYDLPIDAGINEELLATGEFEVAFWGQSRTE